MITKFFRSLSSKNSSSSVVNGGQYPIDKLNEISNGLGEYAAISFSEASHGVKKEKGGEMLSIIKTIEEKNIQENDPKLFYPLAIAYRNYCAWFVRGNGRKKYLEKTINHLQNSISTSRNIIESKSELGKLLIEEKAIRDLQKGISVLEGLKQNGEMPSYLNSILSKAHRQSGEVRLTVNYDLCKFADPSPAVFCEERKRLRALIRKLKKQNDQDNLKRALNQLYSLAILVSACYGDHDCNSGVIGWKYDEAVKTVKRICEKIDFKFETHGYLLNCNFISKNDWKAFVSTFGDTSISFDPLKL